MAPSQDLGADSPEPASPAAVPPFLAKMFNPLILCAFLILGPLLLGIVSIAT